MESDNMIKKSAIADESYEIPVVEISESSDAETEYEDFNVHSQNQDINDDGSKLSALTGSSLVIKTGSTTNGNETFPVIHNEQQEAPSNFDLHRDLFEELLARCKNYFTFPQDDKIVEKIKKYFEAVDLDYKHSSECISLLKMFVEQLEQRKNDIYVFIKEILDEFKQRRTSQHLLENKSDLPVKPERIKKLEKYLEVLDRKIKKIQAKEVDLDADNNSDYILECRLKERFIKVYNLLANLTGCDHNEASIPRRKIKFNATRYPEINRDISKRFSKNPDFPDYATVLKVIEKTNERESLHLSEVLMHQLAKEAFIEIGEELKRRRQSDFVSNIGCYLTDTIDFDNSDPAATDEVLKAKLIQNQQTGKKRLEEVLEKFSNMKELPPDSNESGNTETDISDQSDESEFEIFDPLKEATDPARENSHRDAVPLKRNRENSPSLHTNDLMKPEEPQQKKLYLSHEEDEDIIVLD